MGVMERAAKISRGAATWFMAFQPPSRWTSGLPVRATLEWLQLRYTIALACPPSQAAFSGQRSRLVPCMGTSAVQHTPRGARCQLARSLISESGQKCFIMISGRAPEASQHPSAEGMADLRSNLKENIWCSFNLGISHRDPSHDEDDDDEDADPQCSCLFRSRRRNRYHPLGEKWHMLCVWTVAQRGKCLSNF